MKNLILTIILVGLSAAIFGQEAKVITDKEKYKFDEIIEVTFLLNAEYDSIDLPEFEGFRIIGGPARNSSVSIQKGEKTISESSIYKLRPMVSGRLEIESPIYFIDGQEFKGKPVSIRIDPSNLTAGELEEKEIQEFIDDGIKPKGTTRIIIYENMGYIEIFGEKAWQFHRRLTSEEIERIKQIE